jgi:sodium/bile acid cotransporter 7
MIAVIAIMAIVHGRRWRQLSLVMIGIPAMNAIRRAIDRLPGDRFLLLLVATVGLALLLPAQGALGRATEAATTAAIALLFFLYGARFAPAAVWSQLTHWRLQSLVFASTFLLFPAIGLGLGALVRPWLPADLTTGLVFLCLLPSTVQSSIAFTAIARGNVPAALCSASLSNLSGVLATPLLVSLLLAGHGGVSGAAVGDIALQILLPFALGQAARPWIGDWLGRHRAVTAVVDRGSILLIVYAAFSAGMVTGVWQAVSPADLVAVLALDLAVLGLVIGTTTLVSRLLGFPIEDEIAIVFCGSKKSMAGGIPMASILFPGHAAGLIVLPLMIFHQAQLFVCATLARRYAARRPRPAAAAPPAALPEAG